MLYNENDPKVAAWLRELISRGHLPVGVVDERSIAELRPDECHETSHFFAGIGGWPLALSLAGWPADAPVWTGSCPCQPFSAAGRRRGHEDARHLWPVWFRLIAERRPPVVFGEQVASGDGRRWLAGVRADLETLGYAVGAADLCAAGSGAPHIRQRLYWVAVSEGERRDWRADDGDEGRGQRASGPDGASRRLGDADAAGSQGRGLLGGGRAGERAAGAAGAPRGVADDKGAGRDEGGANGRGRAQGGAEEERAAGLGLRGASFWEPFSLVPCADGKARRVEPGSFPLAHGVPARVVRLRGYGNAVVPQVAAMFVTAFMERSDR